jgi:hypothetical protein
MKAEINIGRTITKDELLELYRTFCKVYDIKIDAEKEKKFLLNHYESLTEEGNFCHTLFMGAKFSGSGINGYYIFHGCDDSLQKQEQERIGIELKKRIEKQFGNISD